ncbi:acyclic terpene utilization AtuA family protein [Cupriavidus sp. UME77]|uniref:acyclic terpene utilization AtuA family protein n=1 Tax=Cupriavidus sp. UME77 TaxID=1862321 RepID=UPI0016000D69|nr:acyclic terpene utilization AtuA family protein [Cupriavidus sp. UME77]MBB1633169.1 terpene utilization protein AtuA [Cupriavidus sp. UME77]
MNKQSRQGKENVRIGGASGFWGDSAIGPVQLVDKGDIDYLVFDYLAELTMSLLAAARLKNPEAGYALDFVTGALRSVLKPAMEKGIRIVSNAGGVNPRACAAAVRKLAEELGVTVRVAVVDGDDLLPQLDALREAGTRDMQSGAAMPARILTANAYLGAVPIRAALDAGADIVITGRCVDSAVTLGVLMHEFNWSPTDYDLLSAGSLAGHIIECGCQATGGLHTDWEQVPDWANIGYPVVTCRADGTFLVGKPPGTGGLVSPATVGEQMLYEIGDPAAYLLPDVICDFTGVTLRQAGPDLVEVQGAKGRPPTASYKVSATYADGYRCSAQLTIVGFDAVRKARRSGEAFLARTRGMLARAGQPDFTETRLDVLGTAAAFGPHVPQPALFEAVMWLAVTHPDKRALEMFAREIAPAGTSWSPGTTGVGGRPSVSMAIKQFPFLVPKTRVQPAVWLDEQAVPLPAALACASDTQASTVPAAGPARVSTPCAAATEPAADWVDVPLIRLAYGRSGDKGDFSNIGILARDAAYLPLIAAQLTESAVAAFLAHNVKGRVTRYFLPGIGAFNFLCEQALGGGGMASLRNDPLGKGMGQVLLAMPVRVPPALARALGA